MVDFGRFLVDCFKDVSLIFQGFLDGFQLIFDGIVIHVNLMVDRFLFRKWAAVVFVLCIL